MPRIRPFDANCMIGRHRLLAEGGPQSVDDLLADLDHHGVAEALVVDCLSRENHPAEGNGRILERLAAQPRLHPLWAALPTGADEGLPSPGAWVDRLREVGVGAVLLCPRQYRFPLTDWCVDELLEPLAEARVPVIVDGNDLGEPLHWDYLDWEAIVALCRRWPTLPVVAREWRIRRAQRTIYRTLDACPNLRIDLAGYWLYRGIEYLTERWGAERLLYGSCWPLLNMGQALAPVLLAEVSDEAKALIAGDNLRLLLSRDGAPIELPTGASTDAPPTPRERLVVGTPSDGCGAREVRKPVGVPIWDCHGHLGGRMCHYHVPGGGLDETVREMERLGVERCCAFSFAGVLSDECHGNDLVAEAVRRYPERFVGFALLNPRRGAEAMRTELARCEALGLRGIKLIPHYQGFPTEHPLIEVACEWANERGWIVLNHDWGSPEWLRRLVETYSEACFFTGHCTTAHAETMRRHDNLFVCSCPLLGPGDCERVVAEIGADRLLFGSDLQDLPIAWGLGPILYARIPDEDKRRILGGNLQAILRRWSLPPEG